MLVGPPPTSISLSTAPEPASSAQTTPLAWPAAYNTSPFGPAPIARLDRWRRIWTPLVWRPTVIRPDSRPFADTNAIVLGPGGDDASEPAPIATNARVPSLENVTASGLSPWWNWT